MGCVGTVGEWGGVGGPFSTQLPPPLLSQLPNGTRKEVTGSTGWGSGEPGSSSTATIYRSGSGMLYKVSESQFTPWGEVKSDSG